MKTHIQLTSELTAALICAAGCFAVWLFACRPASQAAASRAPRAELTRLSVDEKTLDKLKAPTLFALPSETGFSGQFIQEKIERRVTLDKPAPAELFLAMKPSATPALDPDQLSERAVLPPDALPVPGAGSPTVPVRASGTMLFFSPELKPRALSLSPDALPGTPLQEPVRANLTVRADGTVESVFFDTPVTNAAMINAVRRLTFSPAAKPADGWVDIRFTQEDAE